MKKQGRLISRMIAVLLALTLLMSCLPAALAESFSAYVKSASMAVYSDASLSRRIGTLNQYTVVTVTDFSGSVAKISAYGNSGYAKVSDMNPVAAVAVEVTARYATRAYQQPDLSSASISIPKGTVVNLIVTNGEWSLVEKGGVGAYMLTDSIAPKTQVPATPAPTRTPAPTQTPAVKVETFPAWVSADSLTVRSGISDSASAVVVLTKGAQLTVTAYTAEWAMVSANGNFGYARISGLSRAPVATPEPSIDVIEERFTAEVTAATLAVYRSPSDRAGVLGTLSKGMRVTVTGYSAEWARLEMAGSVGYARIIGLTRNLTPDPTATPVPTAAPTAANYIPATVTAASVKVYAFASSSATQIAQLAKGWQVNVLGISGSWAQIELNGSFGYCAVSALTPNFALSTPVPTPSPTPTPAPTKAPSQEVLMTPVVVTGSSAKIYARNNASSQCYGTMPQGLRVNLIAVSGGWALIEYAGNFAFTQATNLGPVGSEPTPTPTVLPTAAPTAAPTPTPSTENAVSGTVVVDAVKVYAAADASSKQIGTLFMGERVNVLSVSGNWVLVERSGNFGYCALAALRPTDSLATPVPTVQPTATPTPGPTDGYRVEVFKATVVGDEAMLYATASETAVGQSVAQGSSVTVNAYNAVWAYVECRGIKGYMLISDLSRTEYAVLKKGSTGAEVSTLEKALLSLGYLDVQPGSAYTSNTEAAVKLFQNACGLSVTGEADQTTLRVLYSGSAPVSSLLSASYSRGSSGTNVNRIQMRLYVLGYLSKGESVDGDYGTITYTAIRLFQENNGLTVSGTADSATLRKLYSTGAAGIGSNQKAADVNTVVEPIAGSQQNNSTEISSTLASVTSTYSASMSDAEKLEYAIYVGQNQLGKPYIYGANGTAAYDCTGFTCYCFRQIGFSLERSAINQGYSNAHMKVNSISELKRGDLVFFNTISDNDLSDHAGIYLGAGFFIHASSGQGKVVVSSLASGYYNRVFSWGRRVFP